MALARQAMNITPEAILRSTEQVDFININSLLSEEERSIRDRVRALVDQRIIPVAAEYWDKAQFPFELVPELGKLGIMGGTIQGYGCAGWNNFGSGGCGVERKTCFLLLLLRLHGTWEDYMGAFFSYG